LINTYFTTTKHVSAASNVISTVSLEILSVGEKKLLICLSNIESFSNPDLMLISDWGVVICLSIIQSISTSIGSARAVLVKPKEIKNIIKIQYAANAYFFRR